MKLNQTKLKIKLSQTGNLTKPILKLNQTNPEIKPNQT